MIQLYPRGFLKSRAAYRDKHRGQGELRAKCCVVALGNKDPDLQGPAQHQGEQQNMSF